MNWGIEIQEDMVSTNFYRGTFETIPKVLSFQDFKNYYNDAIAIGISHRKAMVHAFKCCEGKYR